MKVFRSLTNRTVALAIVSVFASAQAFAGQGAAAAKPAALSSAERAALEHVRTETIREVTTALAAPEMEGRGTATPGGERAAHYIADRFSSLGLKPLGDNGTYFQAVPFRATLMSPETSFTAGTANLAFAKEFIPAPPFTSDHNEASGQLVFVGYGVASEELKRDDFAGLDVKGKIAVVLSGHPKNVDEKVWEKAASQQALFGGLMMRGVAGVVIAGYGSGKYNYEFLSDFLTRRSVTLASTPPMPMKLPPIILVSDAGAEKLLAGSGPSYADTRAKAEAGEAVSRDLGKPGAISVTLKREEVTGSNVAGVLEGSDPTLKAQAVVFSAHYDAFGRGSDGRIYSGAADNALGVGEMLAIAEAIGKANARPRRSVVFVAFTGEEYGLLGAKHWAEHPTWPLANVAANVNFDGIGTEVYGPVKQVVGFGAEYSTIGPIFEGAVAAMDLKIIPDPMPEEKAFYRSDHYALVKKGVPALMPLGGPDGDTAVWIKKASAWLETDYHQPGDVIRPDWNWDGARTIASLGLLVALRVAASDAMPEWLPSSPFGRTPKQGASAPPDE